MVTVGGQASQPSLFTVRPGGIFFVDPGGSDGDPGSLAQPWATVAHAEETIGAGGTVYVRDGIVETGEDAFDAALAIESEVRRICRRPSSPTPARTPPSARPALEYGVRVPNNEGPRPVTGSSPAWFCAARSRRWRSAATALEPLAGGGQRHLLPRGRRPERLFRGLPGVLRGLPGQPGPPRGTPLPTQPSKQYHAVYFTTDTNHVEVGWNHIHDNATCRAIQFHSSPLCVPSCGPGDTTGFNQYDLSVHDNLIDGDACDGINLATVNPAAGAGAGLQQRDLRVGRALTA